MRQKKNKVFSYEEAKAESLKYFQGDELAATVFVDKYALRNGEGELLEATPTHMHQRIASELARIEASKFSDPFSFEDIMSFLDGFSRIVPQGSPMYGIGNPYQYVTLSNCYVVASPNDAYSSILKSDEQLVQISKRRGGVGIDISNLRPNGTVVKNAARTSSGIVPFMQRYSNSIREVGQCVAEGQRVLTDRGLVAIEDVTAKDKVWTKTGWISVKEVYSHGPKQLYRVTTLYGYKIETTENHVFIKEDDGQLVEQQLEDFEVGDDIVLIPGSSFSSDDIKLDVTRYVRKGTRLNDSYKLPETLDPDLAYLLGYSYGNGSVEYDQFDEPKVLAIACPTSNPEIIAKIGQVIKTCFDYDCEAKPGDGAVIRYRIHSKSILHFLKINSLLKQQSNELRFPSIILRSSSNIQSHFLCGYFDADGDVAYKKGGYRFRSVSSSFLNQVQSVLIANGIISKLSCEKRPNENWRNLFSLAVVGTGSQSRFIKFMGDSCKVKIADGFVSKRDCIRTVFRCNTFNIKRGKHNYIVDNSQNLSLGVFDRITKEDSFLHIQFPNPLVKDQIISIEHIGQRNTYDLSLESEYLFSCEGFYIHNSGRRGALLESISVHHPQVLDFAHAKDDTVSVTGANISIRLTDEFLNAVDADMEYEQRWPVDSSNPSISKMVDARDTWMEIIGCAWNRAEPGLLFWDNILRESPADCYQCHGFGTISCNPCAELPLCYADSCRLLILNLFTYVVNPFTSEAYFDYDRFTADAKIAQRLMDDIVDLELEKIDKILEKIKSDPQSDQEKQVEINLWLDIKSKCINGRRTGTGITALGDVVAALGLCYGSDESIELTEKIYRTLKLACYRSSVEIAKELGPFPVWNRDLETSCPFLLRIKEEDPQLYADMQKYGRRNIALLTTAPTGTVSVLTQTTSGIEPLFELYYTRRKKINDGDGDVVPDFVDQSGDKWKEFKVYHPKLKLWQEKSEQGDIKLSPYFDATAEKIDWQQRVRLQAAANRHVDHAISSTINLPEDVSVETVAKIYETAWKAGCKGITVYRKNCRSGVLIDNKPHIPKTHAPKRPKTLPCEIHHITKNNQRFHVVVSMYGDDPYEVFVTKDRHINKFNKGYCVKASRGRYRLDKNERAFIAREPENLIIDDITADCSDDQEALLRMISTSLRHGADINFVVHQLEKVKGDLQSMAKALARVLKSYIKDGTPVSGEYCEQCSQASLIRQDGCVMCSQCGWSKCG